MDTPVPIATRIMEFGLENIQVKVGMKKVERQRYRCKDCHTTFTDVTNTPLYRTHLPHKWVGFCSMYD
jgi:transposase-like protein